jgi:hypothetical protein
MWISPVLKLGVRRHSFIQLRNYYLTLTLSSRSFSVIESRVKLTIYLNLSFNKNWTYLSIGGFFLRYDGFVPRLRMAERPPDMEGSCEYIE